MAIAVFPSGNVRFVHSKLTPALFSETKESENKMILEKTIDYFCDQVRSELRVEAASKN